MNCEEFQTQLGCSHPLPGAVAHAEGCPECASLEAAWAEVDAGLMSLAARISPPADFKRRVLAGIPEAKARLSSFEIAEKRAEYERDHQNSLKELEKQFLIPRMLTLLQFLAAGILACAVAALVWNSLKAAPEMILPVISEAWFTRFLQAFGVAVGIAGALYGLKPSWRPKFT